MLEVRIVCVGKLKENYLRDACAEYEKRLRPLCKLALFELSESKLPENPSPAEIEGALAAEGEAIKQKCKGTVYPLCIEGKMGDSLSFAGKLEKAMQYPGSVTFVIGSSFGLAESVKKLGEGISFSPMTFPHQLARVMLLEQLYRGFQILQGTRYHK